MKLFLLAAILNSFLQITEPESLESVANNLQRGESAWVTGKLADSYENEILASIGLPVCGKSLDEYRKSFLELGLELEHLEIKREMVVFDSIEELRNWIAPQVENAVLVEQYLSAMQQKGWVDLGGGRIGFPSKKLIACIKAQN